MSLLETKNVTKRFGGLQAVGKMDFKVEEGQIVSIIGPNGAGKTTFFNTLTGIYRPEEGEVTFDGHSLVGLRPDQITTLGMARTFQNIRLFGSMTVIENIMVGMFSRLKQNQADIIFKNKRFRDEEEYAHRRAFELMDFVGLKGVGDELARNLPYGGQRRVEIARALASSPKLLLLDEPTAGMNPKETDEAVALFRQVRDDIGVTILLIEHSMRVVMDISEHITVMDYGMKIAEGLPQEISTNPKVVEAYLGRGAADLLEEIEATAVQSPTAPAEKPADQEKSS